MKRLDEGMTSEEIITSLNTIWGDLRSDTSQGKIERARLHGLARILISVYNGEEAAKAYNKKFSRNPLAGIASNLHLASAVLWITAWQKAEGKDIPLSPSELRAFVKRF